MEKKEKGANCKVSSVVGRGCEIELEHVPLHRLRYSGRLWGAFEALGALAEGKNRGWAARSADRA